MAEPFTIQISKDLIKKLSDEDNKLKRRSKKPKPKIPKETHTSQANTQQKPVAEGWPLPASPLFVPLPPQKAAVAELDSIRSALQEGEKVLERLQKKEGNMLEEVTLRAKDLHEKEFKLPEHKPIQCLEEIDACTKCYKENEKNPLKCAIVVQKFEDCARRARQLMNSAGKGSK
ncbi:unnamed protein product [Cuscuta campestris]|uniref:CHCH domain-containing protein n=1 Tax=Cuscuta campestris TaxID=132261 RepID=A0A484M0P1_9ASTE|nr:unnamed protein product [Cuscuta campestris]